MGQVPNWKEATLKIKSLWILVKHSMEFQEILSGCDTQAGNRGVAGVTGPVTPVHVHEAMMRDGDW